VLSFNSNSPIKMSAKKTTKKKAAKKAPAKKAAAKKAVKTPAKKGPAKKAVKKVLPSTEAITKAAYMIYKSRLERGLPGDHATDWLEAERSLTKG